MIDSEDSKIINAINNNNDLLIDALQFNESHYTESIVEILLTAGYNPNAGRIFPLHLAIQKNENRVARLLLETGADITVTTED